MEKVINLKLILTNGEERNENYYSMRENSDAETLLKRFGLSLNNCKTIEEKHNVISSLNLTNGRDCNADTLVVYDDADNRYLKCYRNNYNKKTGNYVRGKLIKTIELKQGN